MTPDPISLQTRFDALLEAYEGAVKDIEDLSSFASVFIQSSWDLPMLLKAHQKRLAHMKAHHE